MQFKSINLIVNKEGMYMRRGIQGALSILIFSVLLVGWRWFIVFFLCVCL